MYVRSASKYTPKEERTKVPSYEKRIQMTRHEDRKDRKKGKKETRVRERGRGKKGTKWQVFPATNKSSRDTPKKERGDPEYCIQENPRKQRKNAGREGGEGGLSSRQVPMNLENTLTAVVTLCPAEVAGCLDRCGHVKA